MTEATWGEGTKSPDIDWRMSASLDDVPRGDGDLTEVTSLERAVRAWVELDPEHKAAATLRPERPLQIAGVSTSAFGADGIAAMARRLP